MRQPSLRRFLLRHGTAALAMLAFALAVPTAAPAAELIYYHGEGCGYCAMWEEDILPIYHKTSEGQRLPLRPVAASDPWPADLHAITPGAFTPTFIVLDGQGREVGRIPGYHQDFFWPFLQALIGRLDRIEGLAPTGPTAGQTAASARP